MEVREQKTCFSSSDSDEQKPNKVGAWNDDDDEYDSDNEAPPPAHVLLVHSSDDDENDENGLTKQQHSAALQNLISFLESVSPSKLRLYTESVKRMQRLLQYKCGNRVDTLQEMVDSMENLFDAAIIISASEHERDQKEESLAEFYIELACLLSNISGSNKRESNALYAALTSSSERSEILPLNCILRCCYQAARNGVRKKLSMPL